MDDTGRGAASAPPAAPFTREQLDAAEPERRPAGTQRFIAGLTLGFIVFAASAWGGAVALILMALAVPLAWSWAGAGMLVGFGAPATIVTVLQWVACESPGECEGHNDFGLVIYAAVGGGCLAIGSLAGGTRLILARRERARAGAAARLGPSRGARVRPASARSGRSGDRRAG